MEEEDSIAEEYDDDGDDGDCKMQGDEDDDEVMIRNYYYHSSLDQPVQQCCIASVDVELTIEFAWNSDRTVDYFDREYDAYLESKMKME